MIAVPVVRLLLGRRRDLVLGPSPLVLRNIVHLNRIYISPY